MRDGVIYGISAYLLWGLLPIYWKQFQQVGAITVLGHRIVWSALFLVILIGIKRRWGWVRTVPRTTYLLLLGGALLLAINWGVYIWAVNAGHIVDTALGYFINPLLNVLIGVLVLGERMRPLQWTAVGIATIGVLSITLQQGSLPWIALVLATSFSLYGLVKKKVVGVTAIQGLAIETLWLALPAAGFLVVTASSTGPGVPMTGLGRGTILLLVGTGLVTSLPLVLFGAAAQRIPLSTLGFLQYLAPSIAFVIGITVYGEQVSTVMLTGFAFVWLALIVYSVDSLRAAGVHPTPVP
ncbi:MAG: EamA family transporter RarD [Actinobacteria bacterium]|nr:EamA family transporter RarD [Actinomycetota bacterium]